MNILYQEVLDSIKTLTSLKKYDKTGGISYNDPSDKVMNKSCAKQFYKVKKLQLEEIGGETGPNDPFKLVGYQCYLDAPKKLEVAQYLNTNEAALSNQLTYTIFSLGPAKVQYF